MSSEQSFRVVACLLTVASVQSRRQVFDLEPQAQEVNPGESLVLSCRIENKNRGSECLWQKDRKPVRIQEGKYEWAGRMQDGDCSLRIIEADVRFDDGEWQCQVTASAYTTDDALSSESGRVVVRIPPAEPRIFHDESQADNEVTHHWPRLVCGMENPDHAELTFRANIGKKVQCESRGGNPAPVLKWFVDEEELFGSVQRNETDLAAQSRWNAVTQIELTLNKVPGAPGFHCHSDLFGQEHHGKLLKCVALHDAYSRRSRETVVRLNVTYPPKVRLEKSSDLFDLEADQDQVMIKCIAEANPPPDVVWRKAGEESIFRVGSELVFDPVRQGDEGTYLCSARNELGSSDDLSITFDVLFEPRNLRTSPQQSLDLEVGAQSKFQCLADGNPKPKFEWLQKVTIGGEERVYSRAKSATIGFANITYEQGGQWACTAANRIKDEDRKLQSNSFEVLISGPPQVLLLVSASEQTFRENVNARIEVAFCSDPKPRNLYWAWAGLTLAAGESQGRFAAVPIKPSSSGQKDCYMGVLDLENAKSEDSRDYVMTVENARGKLEFPVRVKIAQPLAMSTVIGVGVSGLLLLAILVVAITCCHQRCWPGRRASGSTSCCGSPDKSSQPASNFDECYPTDRFDGRSHYSSDKEQDSFHQIPRIKPDIVPSFRPDHSSPVYPLPPLSQFPLRGQALYTTVRRTPQNRDDNHSADVDIAPIVSESHVFYSDLQFPRSNNAGSMVIARPSPNEMHHVGLMEDARQAYAQAFYPHSEAEL
eukprot:maker-scaffold575_size133042-snap-gene-0.26 protein:Tk10153 transcript:maker-scaffold575_size133042-snap-gene-0.26-mRNA-1 annotation:"hypothetical protein DAPPUDRAFT_54063"